MMESFLKTVNDCFKKNCITDACQSPEYTFELFLWHRRKSWNNRAFVPVNKLYFTEVDGHMSNKYLLDQTFKKPVFNKQNYHYKIMLYLLQSVRDCQTCLFLSYLLFMWLEFFVCVLLLLFYCVLYLRHCFFLF